jgi:hypothetical protein
VERVREERQVGMYVGVDEARRDDAATDVETAPRLRLAERAHGGDPVAPDPHVGAKPGAAGAVDDAAACQHEIEHERSLSARGGPPGSHAPEARAWLL